MAESYMRKRGLRTGRFTCIPNGVSLSDAAGADTHVPESVLIERVNTLKSQGRFLICYAGAHGGPNNLGLLLRTAERLQNRGVQKAHFLLVGKGDHKQSLMKQANMMGLSNVSFYIPVPKQEILMVLKHVDAGFISLLPRPLFKFGLSPNKLFDYMLSYLPIVYAIDSGNHPVRDANCGIEVMPDSSKAVADAILKLMQLSPSELKVMGINGRDYVVKNHNFENLAKQYSCIFE